MAVIQNFLADRFPVVTLIAPESWAEQVREWFAHLWASIAEWASQPHVMWAALAWIVTFCIVCIIILGLGFGPAGVAAGSVAALFQAVMYGAFTPAGGLFATLTSMGMLGTLMPAVLLAAVVLATVAAAIVWFCGVGR